MTSALLETGAVMPPKSVALARNNRAQPQHNKSRTGLRCQSFPKFVSPPCAARSTS